MWVLMWTAMWPVADVDKDDDNIAVTTGHSSIAYHEHEGDKLYKCKTCDKGFNTSSLLATHIKTHTRKTYKSYSCTICDYKCRQKGHMAVHMRTHTGEKPYQCLTCNKRFSQPSSLDKHKKHTQERRHTGVSLVIKDFLSHQT